MSNKILTLSDYLPDKVRKRPIKGSFDDVNLHAIEKERKVKERKSAVRRRKSRLHCGI